MKHTKKILFLIIVILLIPAFTFAQEFNYTPKSASRIVFEGVPNLKVVGYSGKDIKIKTDYEKTEEDDKEDERAEGLNNIS